MTKFSERYGYFEETDELIKYREDASLNLRDMVIELAEKQGLQPTTIRSIECDTLFVAPDQSNWSQYPNVHSECLSLIRTCKWYEVYDVIEAIGDYLKGQFDGRETAPSFQKDINRLFVKEGAGWQMLDGAITARGSEPFNSVTRGAQKILEDGGNQTAASEIHEAIRDISRRPIPDKTGAIHHAMGAIECITRSMSGDEKSTLGSIIKSKAKNHGITTPLDEAISKMWGYSSERGRHI